MKTYLILLALMIGFQQMGQAQKTNPEKTLPKEDIKVNREYDEKGNLIRFDSIYSSVWTSDTSAIKSLSPEAISKMFGNSFKFFSDSSFTDDSLFGNFDDLFSAPFTNKRDSLLMKKFGIDPLHLNSAWPEDSLDANLRDIDKAFRLFSNDDSISSRPDNKTELKVQPKSPDEIMKMLQMQMQKMNEYHRKFFRDMY